MKDAAADSDSKDLAGRALRKRENGVKQEEQQGYEWNELPAIGDLVWARLGQDAKRSWYPVVVIEPPGAAGPEEDAQGSKRVVWNRW